MPLYLQVNYPVAAGISHQAANFNRCCQLAQYLQAILAPSRLVLAGRPPRSQNYSATLAEFIDFSAVVCLGEPMRIVEHPLDHPPRRELYMRPATPLSAVEAAARPDATGELWLILNVNCLAPVTSRRAECCARIDRQPPIKQ